MSSKCSKCTVDAVVIVKPHHEDIARVAVNKLRLKIKELRRVRLFLKAAVREHPAGTELPICGDLSAFLTNDCTITVGVDAATTAKTGVVESAAGEASTGRPSSLCALEVLTVPDVLALLCHPLGVRQLFVLSLSCRALREAVTACDSGPWWKDACATWSPLLAALKEGLPELSWRDLFLEQLVAARVAWREESEYGMLLQLDASPEPGLPATALCRAQLLPFSGALLQQVRSAGSALVTVDENQEEQEASRAGSFDEEAAAGVGVSGVESVRLNLLRRSDGALLPLGRAWLVASSGLCGEAGGDKTLRLAFETEEAQVEDTLACMVIEAGGKRQAKARGRRSSGCAPAAAGGVDVPKLGSTRLALTYLVPRRPSGVPSPPPTPTPTRPDAAAPQGAAAYAAPRLSTVELLELPISRYWDVEDIPARAWSVPGHPEASASSRGSACHGDGASGREARALEDAQSGTDATHSAGWASRRLEHALRATRATTLASAWEREGVCRALLASCCERALHPIAGSGHVR